MVSLHSIRYSSSKSTQIISEVVTSEALELNAINSSRSINNRIRNSNILSNSFSFISKAGCQIKCGNSFFKTRSVRVKNGTNIIYNTQSFALQDTLDANLFASLGGFVYLFGDLECFTPCPSIRIHKVHRIVITERIRTLPVNERAPVNQSFSATVNRFKFRTVCKIGIISQSCIVIRAAKPF